MAEWLKAHAWKACIPQGIQGSNPCLSAINNSEDVHNVSLVAVPGTLVYCERRSRVRLLLNLKVD